MSHVAKDREHSEACKDAGATVQGTESDAVSDGTRRHKIVHYSHYSKPDMQDTNKILNFANAQSETHKVQFKVQWRGH